MKNLILAFMLITYAALNCKAQDTDVKKFTDCCYTVGLEAYKNKEYPLAYYSLLKFRSYFPKDSSDNFKKLDVVIKQCLTNINRQAVADNDNYNRKVTYKQNMKSVPPRSINKNGNNDKKDNDAFKKLYKDK